MSSPGFSQNSLGLQLESATSFGGGVLHFCRPAKKHVSFLVPDPVKLMTKINGHMGFL